MGVLGSAFNPPHIGHLLLACEAVDQLDLEKVLLMPTGIAPHKRIEPDPGPALRGEMTRLATQGDETLEVSDNELRRDGPSYTYATLEALREANPEVELVWLMGADAALALREWKRPERVVEMARIAVAPRLGVGAKEVDEVLAGLGSTGEAARALPVEMPAIGVSSSLVRERVRTGRSIRWLVPDPVVDLIDERGLYGG